MAAARGQATRGWLELRDAVLAWWRVACVLTPLVLLVPTAGADDHVTKKLMSPARPAPSAPRMCAGADRSSMPPPRLDEALEPPAFAVRPSIEEAGEPEPAVDTTSPPELDPPAIPAPVLSLEVPERPALLFPRPADSFAREEALLSPAPAAPLVSEDPSPAAPTPAAEDRPTTPDATSDDDPQGEVDVLALIRKEIKQRLPYFEGCATSARRRNGLEVRRLQATWAVAADGSIKDMKVDGIDDPELGACIVRMGSRPFTVHPGVDLVIPTPIVFVR